LDVLASESGWYQVSIWRVPVGLLQGVR